jgi:hypothetical protein
MMTVPVVDPFELIEIKNDEGHRLARKARPHQQSFAPLEESAAVRDSLAEAAAPGNAARPM